MNFENYNKIYKEILDDENNELSSNYLLNKYEIKHEEELLNILNQIKKNEYISSDNVIINRLIKELDIDENLLDINEIINIKDKVIDYENMNIDEEEIKIQKIETEKIIENKIEDNHKIEEAKKSKNKNLFYISIPIVVIFAAYLLISDSSSEEKKPNIPVTEKVEEIKLIEKKKEEIKPTIVKPIEKVAEKKIEEVKKVKEVITKVEKKKEEIKPAIIKPEVKVIIKKEEEIKSVSENSLNKLEDIKERTIIKKDEIIKTAVITPVVNTFKSKSNIKLDSLESISKYNSKLKYKNNKLYFEGNYYNEKEELFGFKIFKITPVYVKFEDSNKNRKRFTIK